MTHYSIIAKVATFAAPVLATTSCRQVPISGGGNAIDTINFGEQTSDEAHSLQSDHA